MKNKALLILLLTFSLPRCGLYYQTDSRATTHSISISRIQNNIKAHSATIDYVLTQKLEDYLKQQMYLELTNKDADFEISGSISNYTIEPFSIGANDKVYLNRVTLKLRIYLINHCKNDKFTYKNITVFADYDAQKNFGEVKDSINNVLSEKAAEETYNKFFW